MTSLSVLDNDARPPAASLLLTQLPTELRLWIYTFVFVGCQATVWFDGEFGDHIETRQGRRRKLLERHGQCCYEHFYGGFALLATCRKIHVEAFETYWKETVLKVSRNVFPRYTALPILKNIRPTQDDRNWTPVLLEQFPNLKSCAFRDIAHHYDGVGPFWVKDDENPAAFIERKLGVQKSCRVMILSMARGQAPRVRPAGYRYRYQYFNYSTGMVYQTTILPPYEAGFEEAMGAREGSKWRRCSNVRDRRQQKILRRSNGM
ncbi:hypothetical protein UCDDA912_g09574 [Diaporthe ampelina]|uniref:Uncharacterized protein n=1 Tax=Diaporthe ampelina TaxID=1214573 RepID=A0A0G2F6Y8_9PEZI|nr:hypothetical protein UCDDA912_g09574 [Diaporthe ampelina]